MHRNGAGSNVTFNQWATWARWRAYPKRIYGGEIQVAVRGCLHDFTNLEIPIKNYSSLMSTVLILSPPLIQRPHEPEKHGADLERAG